MRFVRYLFALLIPVILYAQKVEVAPAPLTFFPGVADSNSPLHWSNGMRYVFNSDGHPIRSEGLDIDRMRNARTSHLLSGRVPWWIEATHREDDGTLLAWYHHEIYDVCGREARLATPAIGAAVSRDNGHSFQDLGLILTDGHPPNCDAKNGYFAGGHGDFSVILDREKKYFYFYFSGYTGLSGEQGVTAARMAYGDRFEPLGKVWKYLDGKWESPGVEGPATPFFPVTTPWESEFADAFWGPSVHYNRELGQFAMLLNRSCCRPGWPQEGVYISFSSDLSNPMAWSQPERIVYGGGWYPMVVGTEIGDTDKESGARARLYMGSDSNYEIIFRKDQAGVVPAGRPTAPIPVNRRRK